jgi:hypothetical protein
MEEKDIQGVISRQMQVNYRSCKTVNCEEAKSYSPLQSEINNN